MSLMNTLDTRPTPCASTTELFWHPLVEDAGSALGPAQRREQQQLVAQAARMCAACPLVKQCLYQAVVEHNVSGVAGGTTARQRAQIRSHLGIRVGDEQLDRFAGAFAARQITADDVLRMRRANPNESLETLAHRLGCSLSTVKRHLRKAREAGDEPKPVLASVKPSVEQVAHAAAIVLGNWVAAPRRSHRAA